MRVVTLVAAILAYAASASATPFNVAAGKPVTITGDIGVLVNMCCGWGSPAPASIDTVTDELFVPETTAWQEGTVWWDEAHPGSLNNVIEIDLLGLYSVTELILQHDNNDPYDIFYRDADGLWNLRGHFGPIAGFGMITENAVIAPLVASAFRIDPRDGDGFYSVSEFQAIGVQVPEPATLLLLGVAIGALGVRRKRAAR
jgi:hypothetical protein